MKQKIKSVLTTACVIYTILITALYAAGFFFSDNANFVPRFRMIVILLGFSLVISAAELLLKSKWNSMTKIVLHFLACLAGFIVIFLIGGGYKGSSFLIGIFIFVIAYLAVNGIRFAVIFRKEKKENEKKSYENAFKS